MRRLLRVARIALVAVLALALIVLAVLWGVLGTTPGSDWALRQGARLANADADFQDLSGSLLGRLELANITLVIGDQRVALDRLVLDWNPRALFDRHVAINELRTLGLTLTLPESPPEPGEPRIVIPELAEVTLPLAISVEQFELTALRLDGADAPPVADRVTGAIAGKGSDLTVKNLRATRGALGVRLDADVTLAGDWPVQGTLAVKGREADTEVAFDATLGGSVRRPVLEVAATAPFSATAEATADFRSHPPQARVMLSWKDARAPDSPTVSPSGSLQASTQARNFALDFQADLDGVPGEIKRVTLKANGSLETFDAPYAFTSSLHWTLRAANNDFAGNAQVQGDRQRITLDHSLETPFRITTRGDVTPAGAATRLDLSGVWRDVAWPPGAGQGPGSPQGKYSIAGTLDAFAAEISASLSGVSGVRTVWTRVQGGASAEAPNPFTAAVDWKADTDVVGTVTGTGTFEGNADAIRFNHRLTGPGQLDTAGTMTLAPVTALDVMGNLSVPRWPLEGDAVVNQVTAKFDVRGAVDALSTNLEGALEWTAQTAPTGIVKGEGTFKGNTDAVRFDHKLSGPGQLATMGTVTLAPAIALDVTGNLAVPRWPLEGDAAVNQVQARFDVRGALDALSTHLESDLQTAAVGPVSLELRTTVKPERLEGLEIKLGVLEGNVSVKGDLGFGTATRARLEVEARGLNPRRVHPQAVGQLDARLTTDLKLVGDKPQGPVILHNLGGTLGGYPVGGEGQVEILGDGFEARRIALRSGKNTLTVNGRMTNTLALEVNIDAPDLKQLWPGLEGVVKGSGTVSGTPSTPTLNGNFTASDVRTGGARIRSASLDIDASLAEGTRSMVKLRASDIRAGDTDITQATLDLDGTPGAHRLKLAVSTSHGRFATAARGGLKQQTWSGQVDELTAAATALGDWAQTAPWKLRVNPDGAESDRACVTSDGASLCVRASRPAKDVQTLDVNLASLPVARFSTWLPPGLAIKGDLEAAASASRKGAGPWQAEATVTPTPIRIRLDEATTGTPLELTLDETRVEARHQASGSTATLTSRIGERGSLKGRVEVGPMSNANPKLDGRVDATLPDLAPFRALVPALSELAGRLQAALELSGTVNQPRVEGTVAVEEASAGVAAAGIRLEDLALRAHANASGAIRLEGGVRSGGGNLTLAGDGKVHDGTWSVQLAVKGQDFEAVKLIPVQALVSPDLKVIASPEGFAVRGSVHVPEATVSIQELPPDVVAVSDDEVIVGREAEEASAFRKNLDVKVDITLGPRVQISAFGLDTGLEGGLAVAVAGTAPPTARGTVSLRDGRFTAYGQDLQVRRGRLLFAGPLDNPGLDVRAVRDAGEVLAGIEISGTAANIRSRIFSEPSLPQAEALSWLLTGRGLSGASQSDGTSMAGAAVALGLEQSEQITRQIGSSLGLDELSVAPGSSLEDSNLVLGKSLSPRLYIQYALGVLGGQGSVKLNYKVTERVSVEAESGKATGADVLYRLER